MRPLELLNSEATGIEAGMLDLSKFIMIGLDINVDYGKSQCARHLF